MMKQNTFYQSIINGENTKFSEDELFEATRTLLNDRKIEEALELNECARAITEAQYNDSPKIYASKLHSIHVNLGMCYEMNKQEEVATQHFCKAIRMAKEAFGFDKSDVNKKAIAFGLYYLGGHLLYYNKPVIKLYVVAAKLLSEIKSDEEAGLMLEDITIRLYDIYTAYQGVVSQWEYDELTDDLFTFEELEKIARQCEIEGNEFEEDDEFELANIRYLLSHSMRNIVLLRDKHPKTIHEYLFGMIRLGKIAVLASKFKDAKFWYERALKVPIALPETAYDPLIELDIYIATESLNRLSSNRVRRRSPKKESVGVTHSRCETTNPNFFKKALIITGPSGVGKSTVAEILQQRVPNVRRVISTTSRAPRPNEVDGVDYNFISKEDFENKIVNEEFLETTYYNGNNYGILKEELEACGENELLLFVVDTVGAKNLKKHVPLAITVFIKPPSMEVLEDRIKKRNSNTPSEIEWRITKAQREIDEADKFDYVVINDDIDGCARQIMEVMKW